MYDDDFALQYIEKEIQHNEDLLLFCRCLHADDPQSMSMYPYRTFKKLPKRKKCAICELFTARFV